MNNISGNTIAKYKRIIDEWFVNGFNGSAAYRKYYTSVKKSETGAVNFSRIKNIEVVKEYVSVKHEEAAKFVNTTHEGLLSELRNWVQSDITETIALAPKEVKCLPIELKRLITKYKTIHKDFYNNEGSIVASVDTIELHFVSKEKAIDMIGKHIGFYEVDNSQKAPVINITASSEKHKNIIDGILEGKV